MTLIANILSIAGSDPSGGAGIQADLKTFSARRCYGMAAITALTAQNTLGVRGIYTPSVTFLAAQLDAVFSDVRVDAVKIGMLVNEDIVAVVADALRKWRARNVVLDPVLVATSGDSLGSDALAAAIISKLFPLADLVTPNLPEAARLACGPEPVSRHDMRALAHRLIALGARSVLVKGGHADHERAEDLWIDQHVERLYSSPRIKTKNAHGTGCSLSSAIASELGKGENLSNAIAIAKDYLTRALAGADRLNVGAGQGPIHHFEW